MIKRLKESNSNTRRMCLQHLNNIANAIATIRQIVETEDIDEPTLAYFTDEYKELFNHKLLRDVSVFKQYRSGDDYVESKDRRYTKKEENPLKNAWRNLI